MKILKSAISSMIAAAMMLSSAMVFADITLDAYVDDVNEKLNINGTFDNADKDWVTVAVYEGKKTLDDIELLTDEELKQSLKYFKQTEFSEDEYEFSFEFDCDTGWYTVFASSFANENTPLSKQVYYYKNEDANEEIVGEYNTKIIKTGDENIAVNSREAKNLTDFFNTHKDTYFSDIKYFYDISSSGQNDISRSQIGMESVKLVSEIIARAESKSVLRMLSELLEEDPFDKEESVDFIENNIDNLCLEGYVETKEFLSQTDTFKNRVAQRMVNTKMDDIPLIFRESVVLTQIENVSNAANVTQVLESAEKSLGIDISDYNAFGEKSKINEEVAGKVFNSIEDLINKIGTVISNSEETITATNKNLGGSGGGSGGSGGIAVSYPVNTTLNNSANELKSVFTDFNSSHWAYTAAEYLREKGVISGYPDNTFRPENNITRAEFIKLIVSALNMTSSDAVSSFNDVPSDEWFAPYVAAAEKYEIVFGDDSGNFRPNDNITRQDAAVIVYRAGIFAGAVFEPEGNDKFNDYESIAEYAAMQVDILKANGILNGDNGFFYPISNATRAEMSQLIYSLLMKI